MFSSEYTQVISVTAKMVKNKSVLNINCTQSKIKEPHCVLLHYIDRLKQLVRSLS